VEQFDFHKMKKGNVFHSLKWEIFVTAIWRQWISKAGRLFPKNLTCREKWILDLCL